MRLQTTQTCDFVLYFEQSGAEQSSYQLHTSQIWWRAMVDGDSVEVVRDLEGGLAALDGASVRRQVGRKNDCLKGSKLSPHFTKPNSIERRTL